jgi:sugar phosphate isomerase/epimerase
MAARQIHVQCSTGPFWALELERALDVLAEAGFVEIELMVTRDPRTQEPELPGRLAAERGLRIASVHGPFLAISKTVWGLDPVQKIRRGADFCRSVGATSMIVHPPYLWERAYARWTTTEMEAYSAETGVTVAVETMYPKWVAGRKLRGYRWLDPAELGRQAPHIALDTSHVTVARRDLLDSYHAIADRLVHVHLSDNAGDGRDGHLEIEQGVLPLDRFLGELRRDGYSGVVSLELSVRRYLQRPKELVDALRRNRVYVEKRLTESARVEKGMPRP